MDCVCGRTLGILFTCIDCQGKCCIFCIPGGSKLEICRSCYVNQNQNKVNQLNQNKPIQNNKMFIISFDHNLSTRTWHDPDHINEHASNLATKYSNHYKLPISVIAIREES